METSLIWLGALLAATAVIGVVYNLVAATLVRRFLSRRPVLSANPEAITLLKPLHGAEEGLYENLESFCDQDYPAPVQIICGVQDPNDPAIKVVERLKANRPEIDLTLVVDTRAHGTNRKISNLINMSGPARNPLIVLSDSDIRVGPGYLSQIAGQLEREDVGIVTCLYAGQGAVGVWSELSGMAISYHFLPNVVFATSLGFANPCFGSTTALRARELEQIGGFQAFANLLADDFELGRAVRGLGHKLVMPPMVVRHLCQEHDWAELWAHEMRWTRTIRLIDAAGHAGSILTHPLPISLLAAGVLAFVSPGAFVGGLMLAAAALLTRVLLKATVDQYEGYSAGPLWLLPARDILSFVVFLCSLFGTSVSWRGKRMRVNADGALSQV
jgi:ceramide glucosyltransferase